MGTRWCVLLAWVLVFLAACASEDQPYGLRAELRGDPSIERTWVNPDVRKVAVRSSGEDYALYNPGPVIVGTDGRIYVGDGGNFTFKAFTPKGRYVATYGEGQGSGPAQFQQFSDLGVWRDSVYVVDRRRRKVSFFGKGGDFGRAEQYKTPVEGIEWTENSTRYVQRGLGVVSSVFLSIVPPSGQAVDISLPLARDAHPIVFDGRLFTIEERAVYIPNYLPVLLTFSPEDTTGTTYATPSYGTVPFPEVQQQESEAQKTVYPPRTQVHESSTLLGGVLTVRQRPKVGGDNLVFDLYDAGEALKYMHSARFLLPHDYDHAQYAYTMGLLVTAQDTTVRFYEVDSPKK